MGLCSQNPCDSGVSHNVPRELPGDSSPPLSPCLVKNTHLKQHSSRSWVYCALEPFPPRGRCEDKRFSLGMTFRPEPCGQQTPHSGSLPRTPLTAVLWPPPCPIPSDLLCIPIVRIPLKAALESSLLVSIPAVCGDVPPASYLLSFWDLPNLNLSKLPFPGKPRCLLHAKMVFNVSYSSF